MGAAQPPTVGVVGCGDISSRYIRDLSSLGVCVAGCASRTELAASRHAETFGIEAMSVDDLLGRTDIDVVLNLTPPLVHAAISNAALAAGKAVYSEKPLASDLIDAAALLTRAQGRPGILACAPATHLGPAQQTLRSMLDAGELGEVVGASATIVYRGPDHWHHSPEALFGPAAGPLFDMGVYALNALVYLLGPVQRVSAMARTLRKERAIQVGPKAGEFFPVTSPTHVVALLQLQTGPIAALTASFDATGSLAPGLEVYGSKVSVAGPPPSQFDGLLRTCRRFGEWHEEPPRLFGWSETLWPIGVLDLLQARKVQRAPLCAPEVAYHLLEVMTAIQASLKRNTSVDVTSGCERAESLPLNAYNHYRAVAG